MGDRHPWRLKQEYRLLASRLGWFDQINGVRTKLVHRGGDVWIYTERISFEWDVSVPGQLLRRGKYLLPSLQTLTRSMLEFSKVLADAVLPRNELQHHEMRTLISGVYVPALHHLLGDYRTPTRRDNLQANARWLSICGGYVEAASLGYPNGFWWRMLLNLSSALGALPVSGTVPVNSSGQVHDSKFVFVKGATSYGVIACDRALGNQQWLQGAAASAAELWDAHKLAAAVLIARDGEGQLPDTLPGNKVALIVEQEPIRAAKTAAARLEGHPSDG